MVVRTHAITISSNDNVSTTSHTIINRLPRPYTSFRDKLGLRSMTIPYSWFNITNAFANTSGLSYVWTNGTTYIVPYPEGNYSIDRISLYLQEQMQANGHYLLNNQQEPVYYLALNVNDVYYAVTLTSIAIPSSLPAGWSNPAGVVLNGLAPQLIIGGGLNNFRKLIGFDAGTYPPTLAASSTNWNSQNPPIISPVVAVNITCNWLYNSQFQSHANLLASFTPNLEFGSTLTYEPSNLVMLSTIESQFTEIEVSFYDQNWLPLQMKDKSQIHLSCLLEHDE